MSEDFDLKRNNSVDEETEKFLHDRAKEIVEQAVSKDFEGNINKEFDKPDFGKKLSELDDKAEEDSTSESQTPWSREEIDYLKNNRENMTNEEMEEFFKGRSEFQKQRNRKWTPFSRSEKRFILQNFQNKKPEEIAENLDRKVKSVKMQMKLMGIREHE